MREARRGLLSPECVRGFDEVVIWRIGVVGVVVVFVFVGFVVPARLLLAAMFAAWDSDCWSARKSSR